MDTSKLRPFDEAAVKAGAQWLIHTANLTWVKPTVKKMTWMNIYYNARTVHHTKEDADRRATTARIKFVEISREE